MPPKIHRFYSLWITTSLSVEDIDMTIAHCITMVSFPPNFSHRIQTLDVNMLGLFRNMCNKQYQAWMKNHIGQTLQIHHLSGTAYK